VRVCAEMAAAFSLFRRAAARAAVGGTCVAALWPRSPHCENPPFFDLEGRVALVTGSSRGIGYAIAVGLAEHGATVVLHGSNPATLADAREALLRETGVPAQRATFVAFDIFDEAACAEGVRQVKQKTGRTPDILVNNAGINYRTDLSHFTPEKFRDYVLQANLVGPFVLIRECAPGMQERGWGRIVNVGSIMGHIGRAGLHAYCASKHGLAGLTKSLAAELGKDGVCVNCLEPGYVRTQLTQKLQDDEEFEGMVSARTPVGRWAVPREMAGPAVFLCSSAASYVNGATLTVDGGFIGTFMGHHSAGTVRPS